MKILEVLAAHRKGAFLPDAEEAFREVAQKCLATGKPGKVTLTFKFKQSDEGAVLIQDEINKTVPEKLKHGSTFFVGEDGELLKDDPKQGNLNLVEEENIQQAAQ